MFPWDHITALRLFSVSHCHEWQGWRWITTWKSCPNFSSSHSELIQKLPEIDLSVKIYRRSSSRVKRSMLPSCKGNRVFVRFWWEHRKTAAFSTSLQAFSRKKNKKKTNNNNNKTKKTKKKKQKKKKWKQANKSKEQ